MKITFSHCRILFLALVAGELLCRAASPSLKIGDQAPKLQTGEWVQGTPVKAFEPGTAYVVEFWATWCGPCRTSIPHLNEVANKFKDQGLVVIGQDCWEQDESLVAPFVKKMGEKMTYRVALDDKQGSEKGKMAQTWMESAGQNGIPTAFLVDKKGVLAWIGHPMTLPEKVITEVLAGTFDVQKAAAQFEEQAKREATLEDAWGLVNNAMKLRNWEEASTRLDEFSKLLPEDQRDGLNRTRFNILIGRKDYPAAYQLAARMSDAHKDEAMYQNDLAWQIVTDEDIGERDLKLAERIATRANDASGGKNPAILDTLARVLFMLDKKAEAVSLQEKAVNLAEDDMKASLQKSLDSYRKGVLPKAN